MRFLKGMKIIHRAQPSWGIGNVVLVTEDPPRLQVDFPGRREGLVTVSSRDDSLARYKFPSGSVGELTDGSPARVLRPLPSPPGDLYRYTLEVPGKKPSIHAEFDLRALTPRSGPAEQLASGRWGDPDDFDLRRDVVRLDLERRADALGALFASRVYVKPHQVSVAHQVLSAPAPRFVLADEVGLGKTIEAGLVLSALLHAGLVQRCLVVAPSHLTVQWLAELAHKFNVLFTLMDPERAKDARANAANDVLEADEPASGASEDEHEGEKSPGPARDPSSPWAHHKLVVTSLEWLSRAQNEARECAEAGWDLVIFDEAHHLRGERAYEVAKALSQQTWGLLLLTATPLQLDPAEYFHLLKLVDPAPAASEKEHVARLAAQGALSAEVRALLGGDPSAAGRIAALFPKDKELTQLCSSTVKSELLLAHLADGYGLSSRLLRNRRAVVGGFTSRVLQEIPVTLTPDERALELEVRKAIAAGQSSGSFASGAVLGSLLRRLGSSPPALAAALAGSGEKSLQALVPKAQSLLLEGKDSKLDALRSLLCGDLAGEKVLIFAEARETVDYLKERLARPSGKRPGIEALAYVGDLAPADRDKLVARFRDPDGPRVLLCTELGGEGRNFQHCHILLNYDLAWSPAAIEQRIGRIDRIGQSREVRILAFRPEGTLAAHVLDVLNQGVGVFDAPVGGLDPVLEQVEAELVTLSGEAWGAGEEKTWAAATRALAKKISAARAEVAHDYDPLLDRRSCDVAAVRALAERGALRLGMRLAAAPKKLKAPASASAATAALREHDQLSTQLGLVASGLEKRLEEVTLEIAHRIGLATDIDVDVLPGQVSFQVGPELKVDALAGFDLSEDRVVLGSFRREIAVAHEENDSFATGHPLIEALFGWVRDGELGRATVSRASVRGGSGAALDARWVIALPEAADLAQGARVPSRRAARHLAEGLVRVVVRLDGRGGAIPDDALASALDAADLEPVPAPDGGPPAPFVAAVEAGLAAAQAEAEKRLKKLLTRALERIADEKDRSLRRLARFLAGNGASRAQAERALEAEAKIHDETASALLGAGLELDQAALVQLL